MPPRWDLVPELTVAVSLSLVALLVLSARLRNRANQLFAVFLFLVAGNFLAGFMIPLVGAGYDSTHPYSWLGYLFLILDPAVLAYFVSLYPTRSPLAKRPWATTGLFAVPTVLVAVHLLDPTRLVAQPSTAWRWLLFLYLAAAYLYCLVRLVWLASRTTTSLLRKQVGLLLAAFGVALVPRLGILVVDLRIFEDSRSLEAVTAKIATAWVVLIALATLGTLLLPVLRRRAFLSTMAVVSSFLVLITAVWILDYRTDPEASLFFVHLGYGGRWIIFSGLVTVALVRYQLLDFRLRWVEAFSIGVGFVVVSLLLFVLPAYVVPLGPDQAFRPSKLDVTTFVLAAIGLATAPIFLRGILARRQAGADARGRRQEKRLTAYRAVLEVLHAEGRATSDQEELRVLRRNLGLSMREHERLATLLQWQAGGVRQGDAAARNVHPLVERFDVERPLGEGTWGQAYLARDRRSGRKVVLKRLHQSVADEPSARGSLLAEARTLRGIDHPNVVRLLDVLEEPEPVLVLEFVDGGSLERFLQKHPHRRSAGTAQRIFGDVLAGLAEIHSRGIVHRDLKPENILLTRGGRAKISDFGVALPPDLRRTMQASDTTNKPVGTVLYMSPEQAAGQPGDAQDDLWAVAVSLHEFLTGRHPFDLEGRSEIEAMKIVAQGRIAAPSNGLPAPVDHFLRRALGKNRSDRFPSAREMAQALARLPGLDTPRSGRSPAPRYA